jgi:hypothetical protein
MIVSLEPGDPKESCVDVDHAVFVQTQRPSTLTVVGQRLGMTLNDLLFIALVPLYPSSLQANNSRF